MDWAAEQQRWIKQEIERALRRIGVVGTTIKSGHIAGPIAGNQTQYGAAGYPVDVAATEADGSAVLAARSDHRHAHGTGYLADAHHAQAHDIGGASHSGTLSHAALSNLTVGDPHTQYQQESEKDVGGGYPGLDAGTLIPTARLGSGAAGNTTYLRGDRTWAAVSGGAALWVMEADGSPQVGTVTTIRFDGGTVTDNGGGTVTVATGGGGGGAVASDSIWDAKGDLAAGTANNAAIRLSVGTNGQVLTAASAEATGLKWAAVVGGVGILEMQVFN
jgi:hypothetical protein